MTFDTTMLDDLDTILLERGRGFYVKRQTTTEGGMGNVLTVTNERFLVYGILMDITKKDRQIHDMGLAVPGNVKGFFKQTYPVSGGQTFEIKENDILEDAASLQEWRVEKIIAERKQIMKVLVLKSIPLEGSG